MVARGGIEPPTRGFSVDNGGSRGLLINHLQRLPALSPGSPRHIHGTPNLSRHIPGTSLSLPPISRTLAPMGNGDNLHLRRTKPIDQPERKPSQCKPTMICVETRSKRLVLTQSQTGTLNIGKKFLSQARNAILIVASGSAQFSVCGRVKFNLHRRFSSTRALASTSSAGIGFTTPESSSRLRLHAKRPGQTHEHGYERPELVCTERE